MLDLLRSTPHPPLPASPLRSCHAARLQRCSRCGPLACLSKWMAITNTGWSTSHRLVGVMHGWAVHSAASYSRRPGMPACMAAWLPHTTSLLRTCHMPRVACGRCFHRSSCPACDLVQCGSRLWMCPRMSGGPRLAAPSSMSARTMALTWTLQTASTGRGERAAAPRHAPPLQLDASLAAVAGCCSAAARLSAM